MTTKKQNLKNYKKRLYQSKFITWHNNSTMSHIVESWKEKTISDWNSYVMNFMTWEEG